MDIDLARHLARTSFRTTRDVQGTLALLKLQLPDAEYRDCARDIAGAVHAINTALLARAISAQPSLQAEIDASIDRYDRFL
jgi:hypothetical protein